MRPRILVTGADGQLGKSLARLSTGIDAEFVFATRKDLDISDAGSISRFFASQHFDFCVNTAAYTQVDRAEQDVDLAAAINGVAPGVLAGVCDEYDCIFIHISSDYVYHNGLTRPLKEDDPVAPASEYAFTKLEGERFAQRMNSHSVIIRTSWLFSEYGHNFVKTMMRLMKAGKALRIVNDQVGCPTYAGDLAQAILNVINTIHNDDHHPDGVYGVFNYCNEGAVTWYDFAKEIAQRLGLNPDISPISTHEYGAAAKRPAYSVLDTTKIKETFRVQTPHWSARLEAVLRS